MRGAKHRSHAWTEQTHRILECMSLCADMNSGYPLRIRVVVAPVAHFSLGRSAHLREVAKAINAASTTDATAIGWATGFCTCI